MKSLNDKTVQLSVTIIIQLSHYQIITLKW